MRRKTVRLIAAAELSQRGYADLPPGTLDDETEGELAVYGYAISLSDRLWLGGYRIYTPESITAGNYMPHVPCSIFTCADSRYTHMPEAPDFDFEAVLAQRGEICKN
jgi:hypothetical protein